MHILGMHVTFSGVKGRVNKPWFIADVLIHHLNTVLSYWYNSLMKGIHHEPVFAIVVLFY